MEKSSFFLLVRKKTNKNGVFRCCAPVIAGVVDLDVVDLQDSGAQDEDPVGSIGHFAKLGNKPGKTQ